MTAPPPQKRPVSSKKERKSSPKTERKESKKETIIPLVEKPPTIDVPDTGRKEGLPTVPIILIAGKY